MRTLIQIGLAPTIICLFYIYIRDKYENEPLKLLFTGVLFGLIITVPIIFTEKFIMRFIPEDDNVINSFFISFAVAALVEEGFKYAVLFFLTWKLKCFNERFDGIVYSVFISLGFAGIENIMYVLNPVFGGFNTAVARAVFSVPGHAFFGVSMGYYFALAKFVPEHKGKYIIYAFAVPFLLHGFYDFILLAKINFGMLIFVAFIVYLWVNGFRKIRKHIQTSPFK